MNKIGLVLPAYNRYGKTNGVELTIVGEPLYWFSDTRKLKQFADEHGIELITYKAKNSSKAVTKISGIGWRDPDFGPTTYKTKCGRRKKTIKKTIFRK